jgi:hypothetical protein
MQRPRDGRIYQDRFWATARFTFPAATRHQRNNRRAVFSMWSVPRRYKQATRLDQVVSPVWESLKKELEPGGRGMTIVVAVTRKRLVTLRTLARVL